MIRVCNSFVSSVQSAYFLSFALTVACMSACNCVTASFVVVIDLAACLLCTYS